MKTVRYVTLFLSYTSLFLLLLYSLIPSPLEDGKKMVIIQLDSSIGIISALLAMATRDK